MENRANGHMRIGILTFHRSHNYGAYLQALSLYNVLRMYLDCSIEIIDYHSKIAYKTYLGAVKRRNPIQMFFYAQRYRMFTKWQKKLPLSEKSIITDDLKLFKKFIGDRYDMIITGSDEIWKVDGMRGFPTAYWLPEIDNCIKISYAASSRNDINELSPQIVSAIKGFLDSFSMITVRDQTTKELVDQICECNVAGIVCDPTMAYDYWIDKIAARKILRRKYRIRGHKCVVAIMEDTGEIVNLLRAEFGKEIAVISLYNYAANARCNPNISPMEWMQIISSVDCLVTTFFHGMCMAVKYDVPFLFFDERSKGNTRTSKGYDFLSRNNIEEYYVSATDAKKQDKIGTFVKKVINHEIRADFANVRAAEKKSFIDFVKSLKDLIKEKDG